MKKKIHAIVLYAFLLTSFLNAQSLDERIAYVQDMSSACTLEYIDELEAELKSVLSRNDPRFALLNFRRGVILSGNARYSEAVDVFTKAIRIYKRAGDDYKYSLYSAEFNLANAYYYLAKYDDSITHYLVVMDLVQEFAGKNTYDWAITSLSIGNCYYAKGDYDKAIPFCSDASDIFCRLYGADSAIYAFSQGTLGLFYDGKGEFETAEKLIKEAIEIYTKNLSPATVSGLLPAYNNLALVYQHTGKYSSALETYECAASIAEAYKSDLNIELTLATIYSNMCSVCDVLCEYDKAYEYIMKSVEIRERVLGENDFNTATSYSNLAAWFYGKGDYESAVLYGEKALSAMIHSVGKENPTSLSAMDNVAVFYREKGDYEAALSMHSEALEIRKRLLGETYYETAKSYNYIGMIYDRLADYKNALIYYAHAVDIYETLFGSLHENTMNMYNNIGDIYYDSGDFSNAIKWQLKALDAAQAVFGSEHKTISIICSNLCLSYRAYGDYDSAQSYAEHALEVQLNLFGENHPETAVRYNNLALIYKDKNNLEKAAACLTKCVEIYKSLYADGQCPELGTVYSNLCALYIDESQYRTAVEYGELAVQFDEAYYGENHPKTMTAYINLASAYDYWGNLRSALKWNKKAVSAAESCYGADSKNPKLAIAYYNLAFTYQEQNESDKAIPYFEKAYLIWQDAANFSEMIECLDRVLSCGIENDAFVRETMELAFSVLEKSRVVASSIKSNFLQQAMPIYSFGLDFAKQKSDTDLAFWCSESIRNRSFLDQVGVDAALKLDEVTDLERDQIRELMEQIEENRLIIERQYKVPEEDQNMADALAAAKRLSDAETALLKLDAEIGMRCPKYAQLRNPVPVSLSVAQEFCGKNRAILEYVFTSSEKYCIVITDKKSYIVALDNAYDYAVSVKKLYDGVSKFPLKKESTFERPRNELYEKLVMPVLSYIKGKSGILVVPDGNLALLPFDILRQDSDSKMLGEQYAVALSPSVSVSYVSKQNNVTGSSVFALGGAWYDSSLSESEHDYVLNTATLPSGDPYPNPKTRAANTTGWNDLPGTMRELNLLKDSVFAAYDFFSITQEEATEQHIKSISESGELEHYSIVHFACHGYFNRPNSSQPTSILLSEISTMIDDSDEDGYLTISESSLLSLNADFVCLSACETGIVDLDESDDMTGLSRAFMTAGSRHVGVSLWEASDDAAVEFMTRMYRKILKGADYASAYKSVKAEFRKSAEWSHPFYWALYTIYE
ncbi:MAG TPA: hypothetical protein DCQ43_07215 [Treponema sp.]|nr:hypothetical protein [Treponema sp.]